MFVAAAGEEHRSAFSAWGQLQAGAQGFWLLGEAAFEQLDCSDLKGSQAAVEQFEVETVNFFDGERLGEGLFVPVGGDKIGDVGCEKMAADAGTQGAQGTGTDHSGVWLIEHHAWLQRAQRRARAIVGQGVPAVAAVHGRPACRGVWASKPKYRFFAGSLMADKFYAAICWQLLLLYTWHNFDGQAVDLASQVQHSLQRRLQPMQIECTPSGMAAGWVDEGCCGWGQRRRCPITGMDGDTVCQSGGCHVGGGKAGTQRVQFVGKNSTIAGKRQQVAADATPQVQQGPGGGQTIQLGRTLAGWLFGCSLLERFGDKKHPAGRAKFGDGTASEPGLVDQRSGKWGWQLAAQPGERWQQLAVVQRLCCQRVEQKLGRRCQQKIDHCILGGCVRGPARLRREQLDLVGQSHPSPA